MQYDDMGTVEHEWLVSACGMACEVLLLQAYFWKRDVISEIRSDFYSVLIDPESRVEPCL